MPRTFHKLRGSARKHIPRHLIFTDTETTTIRPDEDVHYPKLKVGVAQYASLDENGEPNSLTELVYRTRAEFWKWVDDISSRVTELYIYAHNWSFDFPILDGFTYLKSYGWRIKAIVEQSPPVIIRYHRRGDKLYIIDSLNYFRESLASMGKSVGQNKMEVDLLNDDDDKLTAYCRGDVDILRKSVLSLVKFIVDEGIDNMKHTVSSLAMHSFTTQYMEHDIYIDANERRVAVARASYFGGRTEAFRVGKYKGKFVLIDVNSMYPHVMRNNDYPTKAIAHYKRVRVSDLDKALIKYCLTIKCDVKTDIPVFPVKIDGRTCFPVGEFTTHLSTPEIEYGLAHDLIVHVHEMVVYEKARIFENYVDHYYNRRLEFKAENNGMYEQFAKKLLNSLYGKFGQTGNQWEPTKLDAEGFNRKWFEYDVPTGKRISYMEVDGTVYESVHQPESRDSNPAIAAHVTAHGRILMQMTIDYVSREHVYYGDTDSLLLDEKGYKRMKGKLHKSRLGCWSVDGEYDEIYIRGPKDYRFGAKEKIKGVKKKHVITDTGKYRQLQFTSLKWNIRENMPDQPVIRHVEKDLKRLYKKGVIQADGRVEPFRLPTL